MLLVAVIAAVAGDASALEIAPKRHAIGKRAPSAHLPYASSAPIDEADPRITRLLVSIHSSSFDALQYLENGKLAAAKVPGATAETLVLAPHFLEKSKVPGDIPEGMLYWRVSPFRGSSLGAVGPGEAPVRLSAYDVLDDWLETLCDRRLFPNLQDVVLVGHSAGGQMVQRYAMVGKFEPPRGVHCRYVVSAPSSYAYPTVKRYRATTRRFEMPDARTIEAAPAYNKWGYGLDNLYTYARGMNADDLRRRYATRRVRYLCGERDTNRDDTSLGKSPGAMLQGRDRLERMRVFYLALEDTYGTGIRRTHQMAVVPKTGHFGQGTMTSEPGLRFLFAPLK